MCVTVASYSKATAKVLIFFATEAINVILLIYINNTLPDEDSSHAFYCVKIDIQFPKQHANSYFGWLGDYSLGALLADSYSSHGFCRLAFLTIISGVVDSLSVTDCE